MKFWDSSALVPLLISEPESCRMEDLLAWDSDMALGWTTPVECIGALARSQRIGRLAESSLRRAKAMLDFLLRSAVEVQADEDVRNEASRLVLVHPLRSADALQLASAIVWREVQGRTAHFVCLDDRLRMAAVLEGFQVLPYSEVVHEPHAEYGAL